MPLRRADYTSLLVISMPVTGSIDLTFSRSYGYIDKLLEASLPSTWSALTLSGGTIGCNAGDQANADESSAQTCGEAYQYLKKNKGTKTSRFQFQLMKMRKKKK